MFESGFFLQSPWTMKKMKMQIPADLIRATECWSDSGDR
jgi:hypothetical protein